jgi:hypothetical protein
MPCNAMHPIQDLFLEGFSYLLQIDMHFICTSMLARFYFCKKWVLQKLNLGLFPWANPTRVGFGGMQNLILSNFKKKYLNLSSYAKVMTVLPKHVRVVVLEGRI